MGLKPGSPSSSNPLTPVKKRVNINPMLINFKKQETGLPGREVLPGDPVRMEWCISDYFDLNNNNKPPHHIIQIANSPKLENGATWIVFQFQARNNGD